MINIITNKNYNNNDLSNILKLNNPSLNEFILDIGTFIIKNIKNLDDVPIIDNKIFEYQNIINNLYQKIDILDKQNNNNLQSIINNYEKHISLNDNQELLKENLYLKNKINDFEQKVNCFNTTSNESNLAITEKICNIDSKFQIFFDRFFKGNTEKGIFGEKFIQNYIIDKFFNSQVIDTHKETSFGDLLFKYGELNTLIESKNVQNLKKDDFNKFYKDIELRSKNNEINSALFISLTDSNLINNTKYFVLEYKFNIPIIYISNVLNNPEFIRFSIIILQNLTKNINNQNNNNNIKDIISHIELISTMIVSHFDYINSDKKLISKLQININNREKDLNEINSKILKLIDKNFSSDKSINYIDSIFNHININKNFKINIKNLNSIGISKNIIIELGGIKNINKKINDIINKKKNIIL